MVDIDTPVLVGYDRALHAYHFAVTGRWRPICDGDYCWIPYCPSECSNSMGSKDAVRIDFNASVQFKRFSVHAYDVCGNLQYAKSKKVKSDSFFESYAGVNDTVFPGWTTSSSDTKGDGTCKQSTEPQNGMGAGGGGGSGWVNWWVDMRARSFRYDVWVNPAPSNGRCYDHLYVKGGYTHTWSSQGLSWSLGYPWGVGVGVVDGDHHFTVTQDTDGIADKDLRTGRVCRH